MEKFENLDSREIYEVENSILESWGGVDNILNDTIENRKNDNTYVFYDGPATANGHPGLHHMLAKFLKDTFCKYQTMNGNKVLRKVGWDTHGLPVELLVEKELGFNGKQDIEKYGIKEFNEKCKESVFKNEKTFSDLTSKMGQFIDLKNPYVTYDSNYIETEWWILKKFFDEGYFYQGTKIMPHCPRCGTGLASHEVAQGYKEVPVDTVIVKMKLKGKDEYLLVWTTTPWTLISNVAVCVNPLSDYVKVSTKDGIYILAEKLVKNVLGEEYEILETFKGKDLEYTEYEQLIPSLEVNKKGFYITCDEYVTMTDGTGVVHIAPAFGEDDANVGRNYKLPYLNPVGENGCYIDGLWKDMFVFDADIEVIKYLRENDKLFKKQRITHNYPHCWRCDTPLIYYSKPSYYLEVTKFKEKLVEANKKVNWYPSYVGEKRFGNWLENVNDWAISRNRYWGTPLPLWTCSCGHEHMIGSKEELISLSVTSIDSSIDLHRPYVDDIKINCSKCGKQMSRVKDVIDCWFDSGSMPFAQYHYPFENKELFDNQFPADFICEGIDQTRGWFYTLMVISVFIKGVSPFKNVLVNDLVQDAEGKKMSKSKGNIVEPFTTMKEYGADTVRFYLPYVSPVWTPLKVDINGLKEVHSKFFNPLKNTYNFFALYANLDNVNIKECNIKLEDREEIDKWLISKYNRLLCNIKESFDEYDLNKVVRFLTDFVSDDLSNWYIRRNRKRFWGSEMDNSKKSVYITTYEVLLGLSKAIAPIVPFISEEIYRKLTSNKSVHLEDYPKANLDCINEEVERDMDLVRELISIGRYVREETKVKVRQPLSEALIDGRSKDYIEHLVSLIKEELNVKDVVFINDLNEYMNFSVLPNFKVCGTMFGSNVNLFKTRLTTLNIDEINKLYNKEIITIDFNGENIEVTPDMIVIRTCAKEGFNVGMENGNFVILNTHLTEELINEGIAREFISKVQNLRKTENFEIADRIDIKYYGDDKVDEVISLLGDYIKNETLAINLIKEKIGEEFDLNGHLTTIKVIKK